MGTKATIKKILVVMFWVCIGAGMVTLLAAAISKKNHAHCESVTVAITGHDVNYFIDADDILKLLKTATNSELTGKKVADINLLQLERLLRDNVWIQNAELWFDNMNVLHVEVIEREPVARVFTKNGNSFYIDSTNWRMPLSDKIMISVPMFTGFTDSKMLTARDSILLNDIKILACFISNDPFWLSQVAQVDITEEKKFEMSPVVGYHLVKLGDGKEIDKKFARLMTFYKKVLAQKGFDAYSTVDVQYAGQVVATRRGTEKNKVDTIALKKNIDKLLKGVQQLQIEAVRNSKPVTEKIIAKSNEETETSDLRTNNLQSSEPNAMKVQSLPNKDEKQPKAVMPKKND